MSFNLRWAAPVLILIGLCSSASADVITDWNEKAVALVTKHRMLPRRRSASSHASMSPCSTQSTQSTIDTSPTVFRVRPGRTLPRKQPRRSRQE